MKHKYARKAEGKQELSSGNSGPLLSVKESLFDDMDIGEDDDENSADKANDHTEAVTSLRDWKYNLQVLLQDSSRGLQVKTVSLIFEEKTVYGQRAATHEALFITSAVAGPHLSKMNVFRRLLVDKICMLPRQETRLILVRSFEPTCVSVRVNAYLRGHGESGGYQAICCQRRQADAVSGPTVRQPCS